MSNEVFTLPKTRRISEHVHPAVWNYSPDQDTDCVVWVAFLWVEPSGPPRLSVQSVAELDGPHVSLATGNEEIISHDIFLKQCCTLLVSHTRAIAHTSSPRDLPKRCSVISRQQDVPRYVLYQIFSLLHPSAG